MEIRVDLRNVCRALERCDRALGCLELKACVGKGLLTSESGTKKGLGESTGGTTEEKLRKKKRRIRNTKRGEVCLRTEVSRVEDGEEGDGRRIGGGSGLY